MPRSSNWPSAMCASLSSLDPIPSELEARVAGSVGDTGNAPVVVEPAPVEDDRVDPCSLRALADALAHRTRGFDRRRGPGGEARLHRGRRRERTAVHVVDDLRVDVPVRPEHREPRARGRPGHLLADAPVPALPAFELAWPDGHLPASSLLGVRGYFLAD